MPRDSRAVVAEVHDRLQAQHDVDRWHWRPETPALDICLGAILVQHTSWTNVEKALANLRTLPALSVESIAALPEEELALLVRPAGTPLTKARRLQTFAALAIAAGGLEALLAQPSAELRARLLATPGIGPETADVILLYGARVPAVVHDAYTARLYGRLGAGPASARYDVWRAWLHEHLDPDWDYRRRDHAAIVLHCKEVCRSRPKCSACSLSDLCSYPSGGDTGAGSTPT